MIIIKTKTGDIFVNDREMVNVTHNRELYTADIHDGKRAIVKGCSLSVDKNNE